MTFRIRYSFRLHLLTRMYALLLAAIVTVPAWAAWPQSPVRIIVPYPPGGPSDMLGRLVADILEKSQKQTFIVENRPGAGGVTASLAVSRAAADGQTLLVAGIGPFAIGPAHSDTGYHPLRDFSHIVLLGSIPSVLVISPKLPVKDLNGFIAFASASKSGISWGSPGQGTLPQLIGAAFATSARLGNLIQVSYKGDVPIINDLLGGHIQAAFMTLSAAKAHIKAGNIRALAISDAKRSDDLKEVPTFFELGYSQLTATIWFSLSAPDGLPADLVEKLNLEVRKGFRQPEVRKLFRAQDIDFPDFDAGETSRFVEAETWRWKRQVRVLEKDPNVSK